MPETAMKKGTAHKSALLLVDDDPLIAESLGFMLGQRYDVVTADTREAAKRQIEALPQCPDIALVDLGLPPLPHKPEEGFELIKELINKNPSMKILVLSGQDNDVNIQHALTLGAVDFIAKPADPNTNTKKDTYDAEDVTVRAYDDIAVLNFKLVNHAADGKTNYFRNSGTFAKRDGKWQVINWQATRVASEEKKN